MYEGRGMDLRTSDTENFLDYTYLPKYLSRGVWNLEIF